MADFCLKDEHWPQLPKSNHPDDKRQEIAQLNAELSALQFKLAAIRATMKAEIAAVENN